MLIIQLSSAVCILLFGRLFFHSFVKNDSFIIILLRYGGFIGITILSHYYLGNFWTWTWIIGLPLLGLVVHFIFIHIRGFSFFKPVKKHESLK